jgi:NAD(P)-dependent dehydrogenase (short-subunit alcohol dehydrogenase family)
MASRNQGAILVTGASKRIGRAIALSFAQQGFPVVVHYHHSGTEAAALCREIEKICVKAWAIRADLSKSKDVNTLIERAHSQCGLLYGLINNASIFPQIDFKEMTLADFSRNMLINAWAPIALSRSFAQLVKKGAIVNILDARRPENDPRHAAYILSKAALEAATMLCASEFAPRIRVNGVAPGLILPPAGKTISYLKKLQTRIPLQKHGDVQDIAEAAVFLVKSGYITGEIVHVDGGRRSLGVNRTIK